MRREPLLRLDRAAFGYAGRAVIRDVTLHVSEGDFVGVVGPNGSGKSTLLKGLLGLIKPLSGKLSRSAALGRRLGFVPQRDTIDPVFPVTALDVARMGRGLVLPWHAPLREADETLAKRALERVGLTARAHAAFHTLSGGQRQRTLIARALATEPMLLVLDEPTAGVDPQAEAAIVSLLKDLNERGLAVIMVTHQLEQLKGAATRIVEVREGRAAERSAP